MIKIGVFGATGKVGLLIVELIKRDDRLNFGAVFSRKSSINVEKSVLVTDDLELFLKNSDVVIDFSLPDATQMLLEASLNINTPLVIGTTGLTDHQLNLIKEASNKMPIIYTTNTSLGITILNDIAYKISKTLKDFDVEIVETHHKHKKDSPSGTALTLAQNVAKARDLELKSVMVTGRYGNIGERGKDEIAVMSIRGGDICGKHTVSLFSDGEYLELSHTATTKETFAKGAIRAAIWISNKSAGLYDIKDCLNID